VLEVVGGVLFWVGLIGIAHTYVLYPLSLLLIARRSPPTPDEPAEWPKVSILIPAYNEETHIAAKIENCLALDYPPEEIEVLVGSDCSTDRTGEIVRSYSDPRVRLFEMDIRTGKAGVLNRLAGEARGDIFLFTDANTVIDAAAARRLVRHFTDRSVGAVSGRLNMVPPGDVTEVRGEDFYRRYEIFLKTLESNLGGTSGAFGGFYAIGREQFAPFDLDGHIIDAIHPLRIVEQGKRVVFEPTATSFEETAGSLGEEFRRRVRIGTRNFQALAKIGYMLHPRFRATAYTFFSHKVLRWIAPFLMLATLVGSLLLQHILFYRIVLWLQVLWYGIAVLGGLLNQFGISLPGVTLVYHFTILNVALLLGFFKWLRGYRDVIWERSERKPSAKHLS
jgi:cellulose synthase/poly-beta-1,6-N-acetylglucosamine synthase-like glycosyltransferase